MKDACGNLRDPDASLRALAFYLPQYHPVPENDEWWGPGFTEWRNVAKARPQFSGHDQPHLPADLGFYDLRLAEAREAQAALARAHGIHGFIYYHYWFNGRRILERPFNEVLASGQPELPFALCWANENWTRVWDGGEKHVLLAQHYSDADDLAHIKSLIPAFRDPRYIRVHGRPLFLVYRSDNLPDAKRTTGIWRDAALRAGVGDLYLVRVESFSHDIDPADHGFDAAVEFAPHGQFRMNPILHKGFGGWLSRLGLLPKSFSRNRVVRYQEVANRMASTPAPAFKRFRCATPMWDNSARRKEDALILIGSSPARYEAWLSSLCARTNATFQGDERLVFINAWNEWAEGNHLEPDLKWGRAYLEATRRALEKHPSVGPSLAGGQAVAASAVSVQRGMRKELKALYWRWRSRLSSQLELLAHLFRPHP